MSLSTATEKFARQEHMLKVKDNNTKRISTSGTFDFQSVLNQKKQ
ncbi:34441_t:CDS:1, partial [Gigaspora margarita]